MLISIRKEPETFSRSLKHLFKKPQLPLPHRIRSPIDPQLFWTVLYKGYTQNRTRQGSIVALEEPEHGI